MMSDETQNTLTSESIRNTAGYYTAHAVTAISDKICFVHLLQHIWFCRYVDAYLWGEFSCSYFVWKYTPVLNGNNGEFTNGDDVATVNDDNKRRKKEANTNRYRKGGSKFGGFKQKEVANTVNANAVAAPVAVDGVVEMPVMGVAQAPIPYACDPGGVRRMDFAEGGVADDEGNGTWADVPDVEGDIVFQRYDLFHHSTLVGWWPRLFLVVSLFLRGFIPCYEPAEYVDASLRIGNLSDVEIVSSNGVYPITAHNSRRSVLLPVELVDYFYDKIQVSDKSLPGLTDYIDMRLNHLLVDLDGKYRAIYDKLSRREREDLNHVLYQLVSQRILLRRTYGGPTARVV